MKTSKANGGIYYFLGNITSHVLHALPLYHQLGGTFVVLSKKAEKELLAYDIPVVRLQNSPRLKLKINNKAIKTCTWLEEKAATVIFYELFDFSEESKLSKPKTFFLTHGNMLKDYMGQNNRVPIINSQYDYIAGIGPQTKAMFIEKGVKKEKILDVGIARTDSVLRANTKVEKSKLEKYGYEPGQKIVSYMPTYWGDSSVYDTGLDIIESIGPDYFLLVRLHPQTKKSLVRKYRKACKNKPNVLLTSDGNTQSDLDLLALFGYSDAIIGDLSSVMLEAMLLKIPLIFAYGNGRHRQNKSNYMAIKDIVDYSESIDSPHHTEINEILQRSLDRGVDKSLWNNAKKRMFYSYEGQAAKMIAKTILTFSAKRPAHNQ